MSVTQLEPAYYDKRGIAHQFSCSERWIELRMDEGLPHFLIAGRTKFRFDECERWLTEHGHIERRGEAA